MSKEISPDADIVAVQKYQMDVDFCAGLIKQIDESGFSDMDEIVHLLQMRITELKKEIRIALIQYP